MPAATILLTLLFQLLSISQTLSFILLSSGTSPTRTNLSMMKQSIGPCPLQTLLQSSSNQLLQGDTSGLDLPGIVWLEHINLVVGDMDAAREFYVQFLGCTVDDNVKHFNLGQQQFHLAANNDPPQRITGSICLTVPSLDNIRSRAEAAREALKDTMFSINEYDNPKIMSVTCPWGNIFHLYDISLDKDAQDDTNQLELSPHKMVNLHRKGSAYGSHRMAVRGQPGIRALEIICQRGTVHKIAKFYETILNCAVVKHHTDGFEAIAVSVGPGVQLVFVENEHFSNSDYQQMQGVHICIYVPSFKSTYDTLSRRGLIWTNPRFTHLDSCDTWEEAYVSRTLRFKDVIDVDSGEKLLELEHETRPMMHGQYLKVPRYIPN